MQTVSRLRRKSVLFICPSNGSRSLMAEAFTNTCKASGITAFSAGLVPETAISPMVIAELSAAGIPSKALYPKSLDRFCGAGATPIDYLITLSEAGEPDPLADWPQAPVTSSFRASWTVADPDACSSEQLKREQIAINLQIIRKCVTMFLSMPDSMLTHFARHEPRGLDIDANTIALMSKSLSPHALV